MPRKTNHHLLLIGCGKTKRPLPWNGPAWDLYQGPLAKSRIDFARNTTGTFDKWFILSAEFGLLNPEMNIAEYDLNLSDLDPMRQARWALDVADGITRLYLPECRPSQVSIDIHAGADYCRHLVPVLEALGFVVHLPMKGLSQGQQLAWYADIRKAHGRTLEPRYGM